MKLDVLKNDAIEVYNSVDLSSIEEKTIMISGASGQIGTYFIYSISEFISRGGSCKVYALVHRSIPLYLSVFENEEWIDFIHVDMSCHSDVVKLPKADYIIHAATYAQPKRFMENPVDTIKMNTSTTIDLFDKLNMNGKFLFISSGAVYEGCGNDLLREVMCGSSNTNHARSCYIEGKRCGEAIVNAYRSRGIDAKSARVCMSFSGAVRKDDERVIPQLINKGDTYKKIQLLDRGLKRQAMIYMTDCAEILWNILLYGKSDIYNVAGKEVFSVYEVAEKIGMILSRRFGRMVEVCIADDDSREIPGSVETSFVDMSKVETEFHKSEYVSIDEALERTVKLFLD